LSGLARLGKTIDQSQKWWSPCLQSNTSGSFTFSTDMKMCAKESLVATLSSPLQFSSLIQLLLFAT